jgi:hypothetical protein
MKSEYISTTHNHIDITEFYKNLVQAHAYVADLCLWKHAIDARHILYINDIYEKYPNDGYTKQEPKKCHTEYAPILHHVIDWMVTTIPEELYKKKPLYIFYVTFLAMHHFHHWIGQDIIPTDFYYVYEYEIREFLKSTGIPLQSYRLESDARFGMEAFLYYRSDIDGSLFFPVLSEKNEDIFYARMEKLRIVNAEQFENYFA